MRPSSIRYYFKEGFTSLLRNRLMTVASIATVAACIFIMSFSYCVVSNLQYVLRQMEDSIGIAVFLNEELTSEDVERISTEIKEIPHVKQVIYTSPDDALKELQEDWDMAGILDGFSGENNPLSSSFEIALEGVEYQGDVSKALSEIEGIDSVRDAHTETEVLIKINNITQVTGVLVIIILGVISIVIIMNTIKISVYSRRNEINIMKYVGATDWFIRWPFIIEGMLIGIIGSLIPMLISWPAYSKIIDVLYTNLPVIKNMVTFRYSIDIFSVLVPVSILAGILLGTVGSVTSIRKHLKV
ncbi:MAG TPA: ABC transporter permease [Candidatus Fimicola cottocaccae]|uniref:permease-like cell division protein FtsX n=1 Tax=Tyzzerella sp. An114 TaxID=1965545 RepID=UPI0013020D95|nr:permease-like cell division protein FtsX [Tyzzerella sp. An114]HIT73796.1 ABC transporter permease [Candidatus Fimicola cottocaccae]